jgi:hypothetical protein
MRRMISIVDLTTGQVSERPSDTPTFDLPADFDRLTAVAAIDARSHARYSARDGKSVSRAVHPRPLSWRVRGEECLVADKAGTATVSEPVSYTLCAVEL